MKSIFAFSLMIATMLIFFAACQSTPEEPVVIQKDMEQMIEKAQGTDNAAPETPGVSLRERTGAPETLTLEKTEGSFTLSVDAVVAVPDAVRMPIIRVRQGEFTQERVTAYWDALVGDTVLWQRKTGMTKGEIEAKLVRLRKFAAEHENEPGSEDLAEQTNADIKALDEQYDAAPEEIEMEAADGTLREAEITVDGDTYTCSVAGGNTEDYSMSFSVQNMTKTKAGDIVNPARMGFSTSEANYNYGQVNTIAVDENTELDESVKQHIKTTPAQARAVVEDFLAQTDTPMTVYGMRLVNDEETGIYDGVIAPAEHYAYSVSCVRVADGKLPSALILGSTYVEDEGADYIREWNYEELAFKVNDNGIISMEWYAPLELTETIVEESTLMPFTEIQSIFEKMMPVTFEATAKGTDNLTCSVSDVRLEMMRVVEQDSVENGLLIPVWNFYGVRSNIYSGKTDQTGRYILMCINAVDGSVIDISKGY